MSDISGAEKRRREVALQKKQHFQANAKRIAKYRRLRNHFEKSEEAKGSAMYKKVSGNSKREGETSKPSHPPPPLVVNLTARHVARHDTHHRSQSLYPRAHTPRAHTYNPTTTPRPQDVCLWHRRRPICEEAETRVRREGEGGGGRGGGGRGGGCGEGWRQQGAAWGQAEKGCTRGERRRGWL